MSTKKIECIAGSNVSTGMAVVNCGYKKVYKGKLFNPLTWFSFERVTIVTPARVDHIAVVK